MTATSVGSIDVVEDERHLLPNRLEKPR